MGWRDLFTRSEGEQRRHDRYRADWAVSCSIGQVIDLSMSGLRLACRGKAPSRPGKLQTFTLEGPSGAVTFTARIVRVEAIDRRTYELGLEFVSLTASDRAFLRQVLGAVGGETTTRGEAECYRILGVSPDASPEAIRAAYHRLARQFHPDVSRNGDTARQFQQIHDAYEKLKRALTR